eukprot:Skav228625  [mRNA]  locus=scaffold2037:459167:464660:+ [translate_table: standard]
MPAATACPARGFGAVASDARGRVMVDAKRALAKSESSPEPEPDILTLSLEPELPSLGSRLHAAGQCKPCAWFWKTDGCRNGQSCGHCHLCPAGEAKARKQAKVAAIRASQSEPVEAESPAGTAALCGLTGAAVVLPPAPVVYQAVIPQYPTLLTPWRGVAGSSCPGCSTNCVPLARAPVPCIAYLGATAPAPAAPNCEAGERRTVQELQAPLFAVPKLPVPAQGPSLDCFGGNR